MTPEKKANLEAKWKTVAAQAVTNDEFKKTLTKDPIAVLREHGLEIPEEADIRVLAGNEVRIKPPKKSTPELDEEVRWWKMRLGIIHEFGRKEPERGASAGPPSDLDARD